MIAPSLAHDEIEAVQVGNGTKYHIPADQGRTMCGARHKSARFPVRWGNLNLCSACQSKASSLIAKPHLGFELKAIIRWEGYDPNDRVECLVLADYLEATRKPERQQLAEIIRLYFEIASEETPNSRKLLLRDRFDTIKDSLTDWAWWGRELHSL